MEFAWRVARHVKSNAIVYARPDRTIGIGAGQMSRFDSSRLAVMKANDAGPAWKAAGFVSTNLTVSIGSGNYSIQSESPSGVDGTQQDCATFTMVVGP